MPCEVYAGEQHIPHLVGDVSALACGHCATQLIKFLFHLVQYTARIAPVKTDARGALLQLLGARQRGECHRDIIEDAVQLATLPLLLLDRFPGRVYRLLTGLSLDNTLDLTIREHVWMATDKLIHQRVDDTRK